MANATRLYATLIEEKLNAKKFYETNDLTFYTQEVKHKHSDFYLNENFYFFSFH